MKLAGPAPNIRAVAEWLRPVFLAFGEQNGGLSLYWKPGRKDRENKKKSEKVKDYVAMPTTDASTLATEIVQDGHSYAEGLGNGLHHFTVYAFKSGDEDSFRSKPFLISVDTGPLDPSDDEDADAKTLLAQSYKHIEAMARIGLEKDRATFAALNMALDSMGTRLAAYDQTSMQLLQQQLELIKLRGQVENEKADNDLKRKLTEKAADFAFQIAPPIAMKLGKHLGLMDEEEEKEEEKPVPPQIPAVIKTELPVEVDNVIVLEAVRTTIDAPSPVPSRSDTHKEPTNTETGDGAPKKKRGRKS